MSGIGGERDGQNGNLHLLTLPLLPCKSSSPCQSSHYLSTASGSIATIPVLFSYKVLHQHLLPLTNILAKLPNNFGGRGFSLSLWRVCEELKTRQQPLQRRQQQQQQQQKQTMVEKKSGLSEL